MTNLTTLHGEIALYTKADGTTLYMRRMLSGKLEDLDVNTMSPDEIEAVLRHKRDNEKPKEALTGVAFLSELLTTNIQFDAESGKHDLVCIDHDITPSELSVLVGLMESEQYPMLRDCMIYNDAIFETDSFITRTKGQWVFWHNRDNLLMSWDWKRSLEEIIESFEDDLDQTERLNTNWHISNFEFCFYESTLAEYTPKQIISAPQSKGDT